MNNANKDTAIKLLMNLLKSNMITIESEYTKGLYIFCITENITKFLNKEEGLLLIELLKEYGVQQ